MLRRVAALVCCLPFFTNSLNKDMFLKCNDSNQASFLEKENLLFGVNDSVTPFQGHYLNISVDYFPTSCIDDYNNLIPYPNFTNFLLDHMIYKQNISYTHEYMKPTNSFIWNVLYNINNLLPSIFNYITEQIWYINGYKHFYYNGEEYWFFNNSDTNNVTLFFHGVNLFNGIENIYMMNQFALNSSVYISIYKNTFLNNYEYNNTYIQHIDSVFELINDRFYHNDILLFGNSYGSIRITTLCKKYDCYNMTKIILTDPININLPFSKLMYSMFHGVFASTTLSEKYKALDMVDMLTIQKHLTHIRGNFDWYIWSIDTIFLRKYSHNLLISISNNDEMIDVNQSSFALTNMVDVIYTNLSHGYVIFEEIDIFHNYNLNNEL